MKWYINVAIIFVILLLGFILGNFIPVDYLKPDVNSNTLNSSEYLEILIGLISAFVTFLAVIVALFKEDIRRIWEYSNINVSIPDENFVEVLKTNVSDQPADSQILESEKYDCKILVCNDGSISALGVELYLESLSFTGTDYPTEQIIETTGSPLNWHKSSESRINLPPEGNKKLLVVELRAPSIQSSPEGANDQIPAKLFIAGIENPEEYSRGKWIGTFAVFSSNSRPVRFILEVEWNGRWERRVTEMKSHLTIKLKS